MPGPNKARLNAYAPIWLLPRIARTCHDTATCSPKLSARTTATPPGPRRQPTPLSPKKRRYGRFSTISRAAQHRHVPGKHSVARTLAPQRHAQPSQRHAGVQLRPRGGHLGPPSQPARQRRPCRSSWAGAQPARPTVVGALLTPCDQGRHDGCPHRLGGRQEGRVTLKLGSPRVRVAARRGCAVWRDHDDESAHHSTVCDTGALHRGDVGRPVPLRLPQRRGVAGERG